MKLEWGYLVGMALQTVVEPRKIAREVQAISLPRTTLWEVLILLLVGATFLAVIDGIILPVDPAMVISPLQVDPLMMGVAQGSTTIFLVFAIYWVGRAVGGTGSFDQALLTVIWAQFVGLILQLGVVFFDVFAPGFSVLLAILTVVMNFWILSHFIAEMHGFRSAAMVFAGILVTSVLAIFGVSIVIGIIGLFIPIGTGA
ncbi:MAG: Yip1 family protein [Maritimibacter sp.]